jgi:hypothetical protein
MKPLGHILNKAILGLAITGLALAANDAAAQRHDNGSRRDYGGRSSSSQRYGNYSPNYRSSNNQARTYSNTRVYSSSPRYTPSYRSNSRVNIYSGSTGYYRPRNGVSLNLSFGNSYRPYRYGGFYYGSGYHYYPSYYRPYTAPHFGLRFNILPSGYYSFYSGGYPYYFYNGSYYRRYNDYYQTVAPPLGAKVPELPSGAESVLVNGQEYYEYQGTYYQREYNDRGETLYTVVGTDGVLETDKPVQQQYKEYQQQNGNSATRLNRLPDGTKTVTLNGQTYFVTPAGDYYQQFADSDNNVYYELSGAESEPEN